MTALLLLPLALQAIVMFVDEMIFHRRRGLPRWERIGHPLDTLTVASCFAWAVVRSPGSPHALTVFIALSAFSCLFITKDEFIHARLCSPMEGWLHAVLFVLHPLVLLCFALLWIDGRHGLLLEAQLALTVLFALIQTLYWSSPWTRKAYVSAR
jgi:hypothetical protein